MMAARQSGNQVKRTACGLADVDTGVLQEYHETPAS
jgi:hypothetical protein